MTPSRLLRARSRWGAGHHGDALAQEPHLDQGAADQDLGEVPVMIAAGQLGEQQVVRLQAPAAPGALAPGGRLDLDRDQPLLPAGRRLGGLGTDAVGVDAVGVVERAAVADGRVDGPGASRVAPG